MTAGAQHVSIKIINPPLKAVDPFAPLDLKFQILNTSRNTVIVPDIDEGVVELGKEGADGWQTVFKRPFAKLQTIAAALESEHEKRVGLPDELREQRIPSNQSYEGLLPLHFALPPLMAPATGVRLTLPLKGGAQAQSLWYRIEVASLTPKDSGRIIQPAVNLAGRAFDMRLLTFTKFLGKRLVVLGNVYPEFLSLMYDGSVPRGADDLLLVHHWPALPAPQLGIAGVNGDDLRLYGSGSVEDVFPVTALKHLTTLTGAAREHVIAIVRILGDDGVGAGDYVTVTGAKHTSGVVITYWHRSKEGAWSSAVGSKAVLAAPATAPPRCALNRTGIRVEIGAETVEFPLAKHVAKYIRLCENR